MLSRKIALSVSIAALCASGAANAQDAGNGPANWAGQYVGATLGVASGMADTSTVQSGTGYFTGDDFELINPQGSKDANGTDFNGSLLWGMNVQDGSTVYGVEADATWVNFSEQYSSGNVEYNTLPGTFFNTTTKVQSDWMLSVRPRYGFAQDASLFTVSAGPALTRFKYDFAFSDDAFNVATSASTSKVTLGIAAGVGFEHKLQDGWALKTDYLYYNFPNAASASSSLDLFPTDGFTHDASFQMHSVRIGVTKAF